MNQNWINNPNLASIDTAKLQMLQSLASQGAGERQSGTDALPDDGHETDQTEGHVLYS